MATIADQGFPTLVNVVRRMKPDGSVETQLANTLTKLTPILRDMPMVEGNLPTGHRMSSVTALPSPTWRKLNQGLTPTKGETQPFDETCGLMEAISKIDVDLADLNGSAPAYRMGEDELFLEGMSQEASRAIFYESAIQNPERIQGLSTRYPKSTGYTASGYVKLSGTPSSSTLCQSIWIITWDPSRIFGIFPKGSIGGLQREDKGKQFVLDANNAQFEAYVTQFKWKIGVGVKDYRYAVRLQWDPTDTAQTDASKTLFSDLQTALGTVWEADARTRIYMSRTSRNKLAAQLAQNDTRYLEWSTGPDGELIQKFLGVPIRITDTLVGETALS